MSAEVMNKSPDEPRLLVIGGGTMGLDIAAVFLHAGWLVEIVEPLTANYEKKRERLSESLATLGGSGEARFVPSLQSLDFSGMSRGLVIEAVPEQLDLKQRIFADLANAIPIHIPLCSNSSAIPISRIAQGHPQAHRMLNAHFFMPAHLVPGVEVVSSRDTDPRMAEEAADALRSVGFVPIKVGQDIPGFLVNRLQHAVSREAMKLIDRGIATPESVDAAVRFGFGFRYLAAGPCMQRDHAGLDVHCAAAESIYPDLCNDSEPSQILRSRVAQGALGMKAGRGFYQWDSATMAKERERYESLLKEAGRLLRNEIFAAARAK